MTNEELIKCIQAEDAGKTVQCRSKKEGSRWIVKGHESWSTTDFEYRVAPEPREFWIVRATTALNSEAAALALSSNMGEDIIHVREVLDDA